MEIARALPPSGSLNDGDQLRRGPGAEPVVARRLGRRELHHPQAVLAVGQVGKLADVGDAQLHVVKVVDAAAGIEDLVDPRLRRLLDVEDHQAIRPAAT